VKYFLIFISVVFLSGCDNEIKTEPTYQKFKTICIEGVEYFISETYGRSYMSVKLDRNSKVIHCESSK
jgi:hypothetical protein